MSKIDDETLSRRDMGVIMALLERFNKQRLPRAKAMQEKVDSGELLDDLDLALIRQVLLDADQMAGLINRHPEYREIRVKVMLMWTQIIEKDVENRKTDK